MILQALYQLAKEEGLAEDLDFERKEIPFRLALGRDPQSASIHTLLEKAADSNRVSAPSIPVPFQAVRGGSKAPPYFLVDKVSFLFGLDLSGEDPDRARREHDRFRAQVDQLIRELPPESVDFEAVSAFLAFLDLPESQRHAPLLKAFHHATPQEQLHLAQGQFYVVYAPKGPDPLHLYPHVQAHWRKLRRKEMGTTAGHQCLVSGAFCTAVDKHPAIKNVPKGNPAGAALVSFNKVAFESYGLSRNDNAPISPEASQTYARALNRLLDPRPKRPNGESLPKRHLLISDDTAALFWNTKDGADLDWLLELSGEDPDAIRLMLESPKTGRSAPIHDPSRFYTLVLSGAQGRSIIRNFLCSSTQSVAAAVQLYLRDVRIEKPFGEGTGVYPLWVMLRSLAALGKTENLPPNLASVVYLAAIEVRPLPPFVLAAAVRRNRVEASRMGDPDAKERTKAINAFAARCALIRASLIRQSHPNRKEIPMSLDPNCREIGYVLGRMLAVLDKAQSLAIPGANATIVDRYYGTASSAPATVFPTLLQKCQQHLGKLRGDKEKSWAFRLVDNALLEVTECMEAKPIPKLLSLPSQGLFALGFHHQRQAFFSKKDAAASSNV